jgi:hypothetical protein
MQGKRWFITTSILMVILVLTVGAVQAAPIGTAFTYQGRLMENGQPANGTFDFIFAPYNAASGGGTVASQVLLEDIPVSQGYFTVLLDFYLAFNAGDAVWLQIWVRPGPSTDAYTALSPRQALTPTPYALYAASSPAIAIGDNLGNHTATQNIRMNGSWLSNDGGNEGVFVDTAGRTGINYNTPISALDVNGQLNVRSWASASSTMVCRNGNTLSSCYSGANFSVEYSAFADGPSLESVSVTTGVHSFCALTSISIQTADPGIYKNCEVSPNVDGTWTLSAYGGGYQQNVSCKCRCF